MKKIFLTFALLIYSISNITAQTTIVEVGSGVTVMDAPSGTYIKDINNTFTPFLGTWKYENGNEILIVKLEKVTQYYYPEYGNYKDFIKGNYSYTQDGGVTYITNTIDTNLLINNPNINSFYTPGPSTSNPTVLDMSYKDDLYQKSCDALFTFLSGSTTQMTMKLKNRSRGYILPETPPNPNFSIPNNVVLTKQ